MACAGAVSNFLLATAKNFGEVMVYDMTRKRRHNKAFAWYIPSLFSIHLLVNAINRCLTFEGNGSTSVSRDKRNETKRSNKIIPAWKQKNIRSSANNQIIIIYLSSSSNHDYITTSRSSRWSSGYPRMLLVRFPPWWVFDFICKKRTNCWECPAAWVGTIRRESTKEENADVFSR